MYLYLRVLLLAFMFLLPTWGLPATATAQLVDVHVGAEVFAQGFDRGFGGTAALQSDRGRMEVSFGHLSLGDLDNSALYGSVRGEVGQSRLRVLGSYALTRFPDDVQRQRVRVAGLGAIERSGARVRIGGQAAAGGEMGRFSRKDLGYHYIDPWFELAASLQLQSFGPRLRLQWSQRGIDNYHPELRVQLWWGM